ncbi:hypothetical protein P280DRAFT_298932 [Massarina eburnea CBS 473.64]|uniref:Uncharacterized protein n=1 Tax=Massarina eburnea CBS 473.64 TaxID=1395130 RepID=A0A6A6RGE2_9PLEO|nr:hypothetical protein P280DRAFT_298932 [Massarina eburnea CBS 473.64]
MPSKPSSFDARTARVDACCPSLWAKSPHAGPLPGRPWPLETPLKLPSHILTHVHAVFTSPSHHTQSSPARALALQMRCDADADADAIQIRCALPAVQTMVKRHLGGSFHPSTPPPRSQFALRMRCGGGKTLTLTSRPVFLRIPLFERHRWSLGAWPSVGRRKCGQHACRL